MDSREIIRILRKDGYEIVRINGSHHIFEHEKKPNVVVVPHPRRDLPIGTIRNIERQSGLKFR